MNREEIVDALNEHAGAVELFRFIGHHEDAVDTGCFSLDVKSFNLVFFKLMGEGEIF